MIAVAELRRVSRALRTLRACNSAMVRAASERELLDGICGILVEEGGYRLAWVGYAEHDEARTVRPVAHAGCEKGYLATLRISWADVPRGRGPTGRAIRTGTPAVCRNILTDDRMAPWRAEALRRGYASSIVLPLKDGGTTLGALNLYAIEPDAFDKEETRMLLALAGDLSYGLVALRAREARRRAEVTLQEMSSRHEALLAEMPDIVAEVDQNKVYTWLNRAGLEFFGDEAVGQPAAKYFEGNQDTYASVEPLFKGDPGTVYVESWQRRRDGQRRLLAWWCRALKDAKGKVTGALSTARDITTLQRAEEELVLLKQGIDAHFDGAYWMDAENRFVYLNDAACRVLGYTREELLGQPLALINPRATPERLAWVWQRLRTERFYTVESFHRRKDGTEFPVEIVSVLARIGDREFNCGFARDITERKRAEDTLRQEQALFNTLAGNIPDLIYWKDRQSRFIRINDALARRFGLADAKDAVGKTDFDIFADEHARQAFDDEQQVMASGGALIALEEKETWPDGRITWASSTKMPMRDTGGNIIGLFGISRDITERKLADERARQQAALLDRASDAIYVTGLDGTVNYWNQAAERIYGWSAAEAVGRLTADLIPVDESDVATAADEVLQNGEWTGERRQRTKSGRDVDVLSRLTLLNDDQGRPQSILVINTDITELKQLEARFMRAQRLESIGALASGIAHDLNNVLAPIIMGAALLRDTAADDTVRRLVALMESSAQRGAGIVRQVLTFARGSEGQRAVLHLRHLIKDMVKMAEETFPKNIQVVYELPDDLWAIEADPTQMHQVMLNLCVNARDAMPEGGRLTLAGDNATITDETAAQYPGAKPGPHVRLRIIDTGTGIPLEAQERIFEPFFTTKGVGKGTGLGLSTALGIVRSHGGFIRFESAVGRGTTFELFFPAVQAARTTRAPFEAAEPPAGLRGAGGQVLVVDDEAGVREVARQTLEGFGYRVTVAATGAEAIQIFRAAQGDMQLVVTDMMMPELDGPALVRALRAIRPEVPIVGITGVADPATMQQLRALSLAALLAKPFTISDFLTAVRDAIRCLPAGEGAPEPRQ